MAIGLIREDVNGQIECEIPIAGTKFFMENWDKARNEIGGIKILQLNGSFTKIEIEEVLEELELYKIWAQKNLVGKDLDYMLVRIDNLKTKLPEMFIHEDTILYVY